jgi:predicted anti-sigma-YlaC factor YlaD
VTCSECRESLSALLDGEEQRGERERVERHLGGCAGCRGYADAAARITRLARTEPVAAPPNLAPAVDELLAAAGPPAAGPGPRRRLALRLMLAALGVGQLWVAARDVLADADDIREGLGAAGATLRHLTHESSAWNLALAVGFLCVAARPNRTRTVLPMVAAFVAGLAALGLPDLLAHRVGPVRLASHTMVVLGLVLMIALELTRPGGRAPGERAALTRPRPELGPPPESRGAA